MKITGIDGCRGGWFLVHIEKSGASFRLIQTRQIPEETKDSKFVLIDIPMGISADESTRTCDKLLREKLGKNYRSSVFSPPVRAALYADSYKEACEINYERTGKKISIQSWNICPKIREVDQLFLTNESIRKLFFESHPELLFKQMNGGQDLPEKKKTKAGQQLRLEILKHHYPESENLLKEARSQFLKKDVQTDDILDALALAVYGFRFGANNTLPENPAKDEMGIEMAIHF